LLTLMSKKSNMNVLEYQGYTCIPRMIMNQDKAITFNIIKTFPHVLI